MSEATAKTKNKIVLLKGKMAEALAQSKEDFAELLNAAASYCDGLDDSEIREIVSDKAMKASLKTLGLQVANTVQPEISVTPKGKRGKKRSKVTDEDIVKYLAIERSVGDVRKNLGQLIPKRLAGLEKAGKLVMREDGLKKLWKAK